VRGIAWTTDLDVARSFAHGHRNIGVPDPILASAVIPRETVFSVAIDRNEAEIVLDPRRLRSLSILDLE
jgi:hypothetical protein